MKRFFKYILILIFALMIVLTLVACKKPVEHPWVSDEPIEQSLSFEGFELDEEKNVFSTSVSNDTEYFFFSDIATWRANVTWKLYNNMQGVDDPLTKMFEIKSNTVGLEDIGDNIFYAVVYEDNKAVATYTINIRRHPIYTVKFVTDSGTEIAEQEVEEDSAVDITQIETIKEGFNLKGWDFAYYNDYAFFVYTNEESNAISFDLNAPVTKEIYEKYQQQGKLILKADWEPKEFAVTLDANGGTFSAGIETSMNVVYSHAYTLPDKYNVTRDGYAFDGWYYDGQKVGKAWLIDAQESEITLMARWLANKTEVTFDVNGGTSTHGNMTYLNGQQYIYLPKPTPSAGYKFVGWFTDKTEGEQVGGSSYTDVEKWECEHKNLTLYARWEARNYYIWYNNVSYGLDNPNPETYTIEDDDITLRKLHKPGYNFMGWKNDSDEIVTSIPKGSTGNISLYAQWEKETYNITYENIFDVTNPNPTSYTIESETINLIGLEGREGYTFAGWYTQAVDGTRITTILPQSCKSRTLFARWTPNN